MTEAISYDEANIMIDALELWINEQEELYKSLLPNDPFREDVSHYLYAAQMLHKKLRKMVRSHEKSK